MAAVVLVAVVRASMPACAEEPASRFERSLTGHPGDAERGRAIVFARDRGNCTICHVIPAPDSRFHGNLGPPLAGVGARLRERDLRMRMVDSRLVNPGSIMPAYHSTEGLVRVGTAYMGKPVLSAEE